MTTDELVKGWYKFAADCNKDSGFANSNQAGLERGDLEEAWLIQCPGLEIPQVLFSNEQGKYVVNGLSVPKK